MIPRRPIVAITPAHRRMRVAALRSDRVRRVATDLFEQQRAHPRTVAALPCRPGWSPSPDARSQTAWRLGKSESPSNSNRVESIARTADIASPQARLLIAFQAAMACAALTRTKRTQCVFSGPEMASGGLLGPSRRDYAPGAQGSCRRQLRLVLACRKPGFQITRF
jgi:hypothetical protein